MFQNMGCHLMQFPTMKWGFRGSIPTVLGEEVDADTSDVLGGRSHRDEAGNLKTWKFPVFDTSGEARAFAERKGVKLHGC